jgi:hypothetical protein
MVLPVNNHKNIKYPRLNRHHDTCVKEGNNMSRFEKLAQDIRHRHERMKGYMVLNFFINMIDTSTNK